MKLAVIIFLLFTAFLVICKKFFFKSLTNKLKNISLGYINAINYKSLTFKFFPFAFEVNGVKFISNSCKLKTITIAKITINLFALNSIKLTLHGPCSIKLYSHLTSQIYIIKPSQDLVFKINLIRLLQLSGPRKSFIKLLYPSNLILWNNSLEHSNLKLEHFVIRWAKEHHRKIEFLMNFVLGSKDNNYYESQAFTIDFIILQGISTHSKTKYIKNITLKTLTITAKEFNFQVTGDISYFQNQLPAGKYFIKYSSNYYLFEMLKKFFTLGSYVTNILELLLIHKTHILNIYSRNPHLSEIALEFNSHGIIINGKYLPELKKELEKDDTLSQ